MFDCVSEPTLLHEIFVLGSILLEDIRIRRLEASLRELYENQSGLWYRCVKQFTLARFSSSKFFRRSACPYLIYFCWLASFRPAGSNCCNYLHTLRHFLLASSLPSSATSESSSSRPLQICQNAEARYGNRPNLQPLCDPFDPRLCNFVNNKSKEKTAHTAKAPSDRERNTSAV